MPEPAGRPGFYYRDGLVVLAHVREAPRWMRWDDRAEAWVAPGRRLPEVREWAAERGIPDTSGGAERLDAPLFDPRSPRDYQREALDAWIAADGRDADGDDDQGRR